MGGCLRLLVMVGVGKVVQFRCRRLMHLSEFRRWESDLVAVGVNKVMLVEVRHFFGFFC